MPSLDPSAPSPQTLDEDTIDDLLYSARVGDLPGLKADIAAASKAHSAAASDILFAANGEGTGNSCAHYAAANGHLEILQYLVTLTAPASLLLTRQNLAGNTPLHYAALNGHLPVVQFIIDSIPSELKADFVACKNVAGHDAAFEAEGNDREDVVNFLLGVLDTADEKDGEDSTGNAGHDGNEEMDDDEAPDEAGVTADTRDSDSKQAIDEVEDSLRQTKIHERQGAND